MKFTRGGGVDLELGRRSEPRMQVFQLAVTLHLLLAFMFLLGLLIGNALGVVSTTLLTLFLIQTLVAFIGLVALTYRSQKLRFAYAFVNLVCGIVEFGWAIGFLLSRPPGYEFKRFMLVALFFFQVSVAVLVFLFAEKSLPDWCTRCGNTILNRFLGFTRRLATSETPQRNATREYFSSKPFGTLHRSRTHDSVPVFPKMMKPEPKFGSKGVSRTKEELRPASKEAMAAYEANREKIAQFAHRYAAKKEDQTVDCKQYWGKPSPTGEPSEPTTPTYASKSDTSLQTISTHIPMVMTASEAAQARELSAAAAGRRKRKEPGIGVPKRNVFPSLRKE